MYFSVLVDWLKSSMNFAIALFSLRNLTNSLIISFLSMVVYCFSMFFIFDVNLLCKDI